MVVENQDAKVACGKTRKIIRRSVLVAPYAGLRMFVSKCASCGTAFHVVTEGRSPITFRLSKMKNSFTFCAPFPTIPLEYGSLDW